MTDDIQKKRDAIELQTAMLEEPARTALVRTFEKQLVGYLFELLNQEISEGQALAVRYKALGVVETLMGLGSDMQHLRDVPVRKAVNRDVRRTLQDSQPWS